MQTLTNELDEQKEILAFWLRAEKNHRAKGRTVFADSCAEAVKKTRAEIERIEAFDSSLPRIRVINV